MEARKEQRTILPAFCRAAVLEQFMEMGIKHAAFMRNSVKRRQRRKLSNYRPLVRQMQHIP